MEKVYMIRHQAHGYLTEFVFSAPPTEQVMNAARQLCARLHGTHHPKLGTEYWMRAEAIPVLPANGKLPAPDATGETSNVAALRPVSVSATGTVAPAKD